MFRAFQDQFFSKDMRQVFNRKTNDFTSDENTSALEKYIRAAGMVH